MRALGCAQSALVIVHYVFCCVLRVKMLLSTPKPHQQVDADMAAGMGRPDNGPKLRSQAHAKMVH